MARKNHCVAPKEVLDVSQLNRACTTNKQEKVSHEDGGKRKEERKEKRGRKRRVKLGK